ncbi:MAG: peptidyl-prolyl cis-trans isomerase [Muribaculaceae bacterium]|nr:peptidyl-prolyl cis-trans isomerase [Muribaculaceae bacterium]
MRILRHKSHKLIRPRGCLLAAVCIYGLCLYSCSSKDKQDSDGDILAKVGDKVLTMQALKGAIPPALTGEDSVSFVSAYVKRWAENQMLAHIAAQELDLSEIDRMTEDYRNKLIRYEYARRVYDGTSLSTPTDSEIAEYYSEHGSEVPLARPAVRGIYLKVPVEAENIEIIRKLYKSNRPEDVDRLEKEVLKSAVHYDFFRDKWIDWNQIEARIPYDFGSADEFVSSHPTFEDESGGFLYLLKLTDYRVSGAPAPLEIATEEIRQILDASHRKSFESKMMNDIYDRGIKDGTIQIYEK